MEEWRILRDLRLEALKKEPQAFKGSYEEEKQLKESQWQERINNSCDRNSHEFFIIAKENSAVVGIVGARKKENSDWILKEVYVRENNRGQGIGTQLLEAMMWRLDHVHSAIKIELIVNTRQHAAVALYKKCGFIVAGVLENQESGDGNFYTKFIMYRNTCAVKPVHSLVRNFV